MLFEHLARRIIPGGRPARAWNLTGGMSARITALEIAHPDGGSTRVLLRAQADPLALQTQFRLLDILSRQGLPVPAPLLFDPDERLLVLAFREGSPGFAANTDVVQMADVLARIHAAPAGALSFLPARDEPPGHANPCGGDGGIHALLKRRAPPSGERVLLHGDFWAGNLLWLDGRLDAVIDWEDAGLGDPLADLAIARLDIATIFGPEALAVFTRRYRERSGRALDALPYHDLTAALRLLRLSGGDFDAWASYFHPHGRADITGESIRSCFEQFVEQAKNRFLNE
jgi:aminoglycoside phosphotransferase (APT) family kinase protein